MIALYDAVGPYSDLTRPQGGSETAIGLLEEALGGTLYYPSTSELVERLSREIVLILQRWSAPPPGMRFRRELVYAHDLYRPEYDIHRDRTIVCVGEYQRRTFLAAGFSEHLVYVIHPILGEHVRPLEEDAMVDRWIYPTSANKGLGATLRDWTTREDSPRRRGGRLVVTSSGYDDAERIAVSCARFGVRYLPHVNPAWLAEQIGRSEGLYYTNTSPEAFPMTVAIARFYGFDMTYLTCEGHDRRDCGIHEARACDLETLTPSAVRRAWEKIL